MQTDNDTAPSLEALEAAVRGSPSDIGAICRLASAYGEAGAQLAIALLTNAVRLAPGHLRARSRLGSQLLWAGRGREAAEQFREAAWLQPDIPDYWYCLGLALAQARDHAAAAESFQKAIDADPADERSRRPLAWSLYSAGRHAEAVPALERVLRAKPDDPPCGWPWPSATTRRALRGEAGPC